MLEAWGSSQSSRDAGPEEHLAEKLRLVERGQDSKEPKGRKRGREG